MNTTSQKPPGESGLYNRIAVLRAERGIGRQELAEAMDVNYQTIGFLERGDCSPGLKLALSLAEYFGSGGGNFFQAAVAGVSSAGVRARQIVHNAEEQP